jgi:hypothetical protein
MAELRNEKTLAEIPAAGEGKPYFDEAYDRLLEEQPVDRLMLPVIQPV